MNVSLLGLWHSMSPLCHGVIIVLFAMFLRSLIVTVSRLVRYRLARRQSQIYIQHSALAFSEGRLDEAISVAGENRKSHIASVVAAGLTDYCSAPANMPHEVVIDGVQQKLDRSSATIHEEMKQGLSGLATIASTAPFVGLFGTVIGILDAFSAIGSVQGEVIKVIAGSIAEALITTAIGLSVAVPAVWFYNFLTNQMDAFGVEMKNASLELVTYLRTRQAECVKR